MSAPGAAGAPAIAVLGAGGPVGRLLVPALAAQGARVSAQSRRAGPGVDLVGDDPAVLAGWLRHLRPALMVVLWGVTRGDAEALAGNAALACRALGAATAAGCPRVAVMSSAAVYDPHGPGPHREDGPAAPVAPYGAAKLAMEQALLAAHRALPAPRPALFVLRLANVVGADMLGRAVADAATGARLQLDRFADGEGPERSYLGATTLARTCLCLAAGRAAGPELLNVADGDGPVAMEALLRALEARGVPVPWAWRPAPATAARSVVLDTARLRRRCPSVAASMRRDADGLVADWLALQGAPA